MYVEPALRAVFRLAWSLISFGVSVATLSVRSIVSISSHSLPKPVLSSKVSLKPLPSHWVLLDASILSGIFSVETQTFTAIRSRFNFKIVAACLVTNFRIALLKIARTSFISLSVLPGMAEIKWTKIRESAFLDSTIGSRLARSMMSKACKISRATVCSKPSRDRRAGDTVRTNIAGVFLSFEVPWKIPVRRVVSTDDNVNSSVSDANSSPHGSAGRKFLHSILSFHPTAFAK
mmetsp:Transcript_61118/g.97024  ORF Transcript_61118/g.97024 Transcript_61118/m.97024 type:complete len:233 (+) Transcript_61118:182-880(+)